MFSKILNWKARSEKRQQKQLAEQLALEALVDYENGVSVSQRCPACQVHISLKRGQNLLYASCPCTMCNVALIPETQEPL